MNGDTIVIIIFVEMSDFVRSSRNWCCDIQMLATYNREMNTDTLYSGLDIFVIVIF